MSSDDLAISVLSLSKRYEIYANPRDRLKQFIYPRLRRFVGKTPLPYFNEFWALKDVSFDVCRGETIGIIGRNGSGKSTLLQMICGTLNPTSGSIRTNGRVAALLELGAGFNPEFSGRENVYMNALVLGLTKEQIDNRFDDIAAFADIGQFIDQPVKTYSSGMYVRLAFAVIAHVDADIMVVDEALSVGDAVFTQKCMRYIRAFKERGTLLFVSHDIGAVQNLCESAIWLDGGTIQKRGGAKSVSESYLHYTFQQISGDEATLESIEPETSEVGGQEETETKKEEPSHSYGESATIKDNVVNAKGWKTGRTEMISVVLSRLNSDKDGAYKGGELVRMTLTARAIDRLTNPILGFLVRDRLGQDLFGENTLPFTDKKPMSIEAGGIFKAIFDFTLPMLPNGEYAVMASVADGTMIDHIQHHWLHDALIINVVSSKIRYGLVGLPFERVVLEVIDDQ